jgi:starvation-inducible DNA-binding protein
MSTQLQKKEIKHIGTSTKLGILLNRLLADNINLKLQSKQAHWNIKGSNFIALHLLFDGVAEEADKYADMLAERIVQIGEIAAGTLEAVTKHSKLEEYPTSMQHAEQYIKALAASLRICAQDAFNSIEMASIAKDPVTADLITEVSRGLDKQRWLVESNLLNK